ncbi:MAG: uracil-DNA glycosylase [Candidatus Aerophobetes bacterium]|nr:uracil-DNA glycosylase [Candidatus Aerophobetes bacterium]
MRNKYYQDYLDIVKSFRRYLEKRQGVKVKEDEENSEPKDPEKLLQDLFYSVQNCQRCSLYKSRTNPVPGRGNPKASLMLVGEAPGKEEDLQGRPFVGAAGKLLNKSLRKAGILEKEIYIANVLKCHPPGNRDPVPEEIKACLPFLRQQVQIINPKVICTLGKFATQVLLDTKQGIMHLRGKSLNYHPGIVLIPTFHPAACIYNPNWQRFFLQDLRLVKEKLHRA